MFSPRRASSTIYFGRAGSESGRCPRVLDWVVKQQRDRKIMMFPRLQEPFRHILWATALAAALGATYAERRVLQGGGQALALLWLGARRADRRADWRHSDVVRCVCSERAAGRAASPGALCGACGGQDRHLPRRHPVRPQVGQLSLPAPGENGIESGDVLFSLAAAFVFVFILDVNSLLGQNVLINFITGRYYAPRRGIARVPAHRHGRVRRDWPNGSVRSPSIAWSSASSTTSRSRSSRRGAKSIAMSAMS